MRGVCFICGVGSRGLDLKFTWVGSLLVTRRERLEGVFSGCWLPLVVVAPPPLVDVGAVSVVVPPNEKVLLIDAPIFLFLF